MLEYPDMIEVKAKHHRNYTIPGIEMTITGVSTAPVVESLEYPHLGGYLTLREGSDTQPIQIFDALMPRMVIHPGDTAVLKTIGRFYMVNELKRGDELYYNHDEMVKYLNS